MHIPKQHDQNDKAQVVVDCNDAVIETEREQESHTRIRLTHQEISTKIAGFVKSKWIAKDIWRLCDDIHKSIICNHYNRVQAKETNTWRIFRVKDGSNTQIIEDAVIQIFSQNEMFNSKDIQKNWREIVRLFSDSSITKIERYWIFVFSSSSMTQIFKSSDRSHRKWAKESSLCKLEQCNLHRWSSIL